MLRRHKKVNLTKSLWVSALLTLILSTFLGIWQAFDSYQVYSEAKQKKAQFITIYNITKAFNAIGRERFFSNRLLLANDKEKPETWADLIAFRKEVDSYLKIIDKSMLSNKEWQQIQQALQSARGKIDLYKNKVITSPTEAKQTLKGMIQLSETYRLAVFDASIQLINRDPTASSSLFQVLILSNIRDNIGRLASLFVVSLHYDTYLSHDDIKVTIERLERLKVSWEIMNIIPDEIPDEAKTSLHQKLLKAKGDFTQKGLPMLEALIQNNEDAQAHGITKEVFVSNYKEAINNIIESQDYYLSQLFIYHNFAEKKAAMKLLIIVITIFLITILMISLAVSIQKRLLQPLSILNRNAAKIMQGNLKLEPISANNIGELQSVYSALSDLNVRIKEQQDLTYKLRKESNEDSLTSLPNRRYFENFAQELLTLAHSNYPITMVIIDIDQFQYANDTWGHTFSDKILVGFAQVLKKIIPSGAIAARFSDEEFILLLSESSNSLKVTELLHAIQSKVSRLTFIPEGASQVNITVSFGVSEIHENNYKALLSNTDKALHKAKEAGRNCIRYHIDA